MDMSDEEYRKRFPDLDPKQYFSSYEEFNRFMIGIDEGLKGTPILARQIKGMAEVASQLKTNIYGVPNSFAKENDFSNLSLSAHVSVWFEKQYGDRLKVDLSNMQTICRVSGDLYKVKIPLVFGRPNFVFTGRVEEIKPTLGSKNSDDVGLNIGSLIENITNEKLSRITGNEIIYLGTRVRYGCLLGTRFFTLANKEQFNDALADFRMSVDMLFLDKPLYGQSMWHCLQFVEKVMKISLDAHEINYPRIHNLHQLSGLLNDVKIHPQLLDRIQCSASLRYDSSRSNEDECVKSHEAAQQVVLKVISKLAVKHRS
jgi:HEPN domain-containing protein